MNRRRRLKFENADEGAYHLISRAVQRNFLFGAPEKSRFLSLLKWLSRVYFVRVATFCLMDNHFHLIVRMIDKSEISLDELKLRFDLYYNQNTPEERKRLLADHQIADYYERFSDVSRFMQDLKRRFSRWYNVTHNGCGHVWSERFKSVMLCSPLALRACMIYVELNAVRAAMVPAPEKYPYCGLACYVGGGRRADWLDHDLLREAVSCYEQESPFSGSSGESVVAKRNVISQYVAIVYREGMNLKPGKASIPESQWQSKKASLAADSAGSVFMKRMEHLSNGLILGSKEECERQFLNNRDRFRTKSVRTGNPMIVKSPKGRLSMFVPNYLLSLCSLRSRPMEVAEG